jgi:hypothetical protein
LSASALTCRHIHLLRLESAPKILAGGNTKMAKELTQEFGILPQSVGQRAAAALRKLTIRQREWVVLYVAGKDALAATQAVYKASTLESARVMAWELKTHPKIQAVLAILDGVTEREIYLRKLEKSIDAADSGSVAQLRLHALYARVAFGASDGRNIRAEGASADDEDLVPVGKTVEKDGKRFKVTLVEVKS